jgi:hypothetical protein
MTPTLTDAVHIVHGDAAASALLALGARRVLVRRDLLTVGPCDLEPARHRALREAFWGGQPRAPSGLPGVDGDDDLARELAARPGPLVLWATRAWSDTTFLWAVVDALARLGTERPRLVRPVADELHASVGGVPAARLGTAFAEAAPLDEAQARSLVAFWRAYAAVDPTGLDELRRRGAAFVSDLDARLAGHGAWFPWRGARGLALSDVDELLLRAAGDHWTRGADLTRARTTRLAARDLFLWVGDGAFFARVAALAARGALEVRDPSARGGALEVRLTDVGRALLTDGARDAAPCPTWVGGCRVDDPAGAWVRVAEGAGWRLTR